MPKELEELLIKIIFIIGPLFMIWNSSKVYRYDEKKLQKEYKQQMRFFPWVSLGEYKKVLKTTFVFAIFFWLLIIWSIATNSFGSRG
ncbi:MAG TPA: hypothetical protein VHP30_01675 [Ignavibacteriales bacterium]|nr:hypothetical protein [Ignavibacteriales bacterium]